MIQAKRNEVFERVFRLYTTRLIKKSFHRLALTGDSHIPDNNKPAIYIVNHSSWWDAIMLFYLNQTIWHLDALAMMDEEGLTRFPFFRKIGAFSINSNSPKSLITSLHYAAEELTAGKHVFIFPQGEEHPLDKRPFHFFPGVSFLNEHLPDVPVIPIAFYHGFFHHQRPEWYVHIDSPHLLPRYETRAAKTKALEQVMEENVDRLKRSVTYCHKTASFTTVLSGRRSIAEVFESLTRQTGGRNYD